MEPLSRSLSFSLSHSLPHVGTQRQGSPLQAAKSSHRNPTVMAPHSQTSSFRNCDVSVVEVTQAMVFCCGSLSGLIQCPHCHSCGSPLTWILCSLREGKHSLLLNSYPVVSGEHAPPTSTAASERPTTSCELVKIQCI